MKYNLLTLSFTGECADLEGKFQRHFHETSLLRIRIAIAVSIVLYGVFGILDHVMAPQKAYLFWIIRFCAVIPFLTGVLVLSFHKNFEKYGQLSLFLACLAAGLGIVAMVMMDHSETGFSYYAGIILVFINIHTFVRLRWIWAVSCSISIIIIYETAAIAVIKTPFHILVNNNFFFISSALLSMLAGYVMELNTRRLFFSNHMLSIEKEKVHQANQDLDRRVKERTRELSRANERLQHEMKERLQAQEKQMQLETAMTRRQNSEALGTLAGGIAHDFNNILAAIIGYTELIQGEIHHDHELSEHTEAVLEAAFRARDLTRQILAFSRQEEQAHHPFDPVPVIDEAVKMMRASIPSTVCLQTHFSARNQIISDPTQIHRVIINLCTNGVLAMENQKGILDLRLEDMTLVEMPLDFPDPLPPGPYVKLTVMDTGKGMEKEIMDKIFTPFFSTRGVNQGTGMGLAVVQGIVKKSRGSIRVESFPGKGSVFTILLPASTEPEGSESVESDDNAQGIQGSGEHILFVDDEPALVSIMTSTLAGLNYKVTTASSPDQALAVFNSDPAAFDLVITDYAMPGMNGLELSQAIHAKVPKTPILLCTGYSENITREKINQAGVQAFLMKPLTRKILGTTLKQIFGDRKIT